MKFDLVFANGTVHGIRKYTIHRLYVLFLYYITNKQSNFIVLVNPGNTKLNQ